MQNDTISRTEAMRQFTAEPKMSFSLGEIVAKLDALPVVDAVEVVRCPSCLYHIDDGYHECIEFGIRIPDDAEFFCKYGKRREDAAP